MRLGSDSYDYVYKEQYEYMLEIKRAYDAGAVSQGGVSPHILRPPSAIPTFSRVHVCLTPQPAPRPGEGSPSPPDPAVASPETNFPYNCHRATSLPPLRAISPRHPPPHPLALRAPSAAASADPCHSPAATINQFGTSIPSTTVVPAITS